MSRKRADLVVSIAITAIIGWMVWEARGWDARARLFPVAIGIPALCLALLQVGFATRSVKASAVTARSVTAAEVAPRSVKASEVTALAADPQTAQRTRQMIAWVVAMAVGIVLLGFEIGSALLTFAFLRLAARERVWLSLTLSIVTFLSFYLIFDRGLNIPFPPGVLTGWK